MNMIAMKLKEIRIKRGMSQRRFADSIGVPLGTYKSWEYSLSVPDYRYRETLERIDPALIKVWERDKMAV